MPRIIESIKGIVGREQGSGRNGWDILRDGNAFAEVQEIRFKKGGVVREFRVGVGDVGSVCILWEDNEVENLDNLYSGLVFVGDPYQERVQDGLSVGFSRAQSETGWMDVCHFPERIMGDDGEWLQNPILTDPFSYKVAVARLLPEPVFTQDQVANSSLSIVDFIQLGRLTT